ncbi:hypothetical protein PMIN06_000612 [Paraphaeosphaeria minitans]
MAAFSRITNPPNLFTYLANCTGAEMVQIMQGMQDPKAKAVLTAALLCAPSPASGRATLPEKVKKALNAFVGFRCYYLNIPPFKDFPMKKLSQPLGTLWDSDPNKSKWSLMTKAWSIMRDQLGKDKVPLEGFFRYACPYLNVPPPSEYLQQLGWVLFVDQHGALVVEQGPSFTTQLARFGFMDEAHSVEDIIRHVQACGFATKFVLNSNSTSATFLGHSNNLKSRTTIKKQTALSVQAAKKRVAERDNRQMKRQLALQAGFAVRLHDPLENLSVTGGMSGTSNNGEDHQTKQQLTNQTPSTELNFSIGTDVYQFIQHSPSGTDDQYISADPTLYDEMHALAAKYISESNESIGYTMEQPSDMAQGSLAGLSNDVPFFSLPPQEIQDSLTAFREGANFDSTLPDMDD